MRLLPLALGLAAALYAAPPDYAKQVTIHRDQYGVPHVYGPTDASCVFGYIYAQAEDNFWQIEDNYIRGLGRASELYGEKTLAEDLLVQALEIPRLSQAEYQRLSPRSKEMLDALAAGLNYFLATNPKAKPRLIQKFEPWHTLAFSRYALYVNFLSKQTGVGPTEIINVATQGSNMWAAAPSKSASKKALLFINPHQPFFGPGQWYEGHVKSGEGWNLSGANFFGSGFPTIGHNEHLGWSHTVNRPDVYDVYEETFDHPSDPLQYRYGKEYRKAVEWRVTLKVNGADKSYTLRKTHHGPIVGEKNGKKLALKFARLEEGGQMEEWYEMGKARNLGEFKKAMERTAIPLFNTMYADRDGNIFYVYNGSVPRRAQKFDWSKPVDGADPETEWAGYHPLNELPQVENPKSGFVQNCNSSPFTTTVFDNPDPAKFPKYMAPENDNARARISRRILWNRPQFSFDDWAKAAFDTTIIQAETDIPRIATAWEELRKKDAARAARLIEPLTELREWDHVSTTASVPMTLYTLWYLRTHRTPLSPVANPREDAAEALEAVVKELEKNHGTWRVAWGEINRLQRAQSGGEEPFRDDRSSVAVAGAPGDLGVVFNFYARPEKDQKRRYGVAGHSFVSVVEFGEKVQARSILVFGQNSDPASKNYFDQSELYAKQQFKPAWFWDAEVKKNAVSSYSPSQRAKKAVGAVAGR